MIYLDNKKEMSIFKSLELIKDENVSIQCTIQNFRKTKWGGFLVLRINGQFFQGIFESNQTKFIKDGNELSEYDLKNETAICIKGIVREAKINSPVINFREAEVMITEIEILNEPDVQITLDLNKGFNEAFSMQTKLNQRTVSLRNPYDIAIFKINSEISYAFTSYLRSKNFTQIFTPKLVSEGAEGGANIFDLDYFGKRAYLAQSPQFYKQICVGVFDKVFEVAPVYRAEKHDTSRHLNEYISLDVEFGFIESYKDVMKLQIDLVKYIFSELDKSCKKELQLFNVTLPNMNNEVPCFTIDEIHAIVKKEYNEDYIGEPDLNSTEEKYMGEYVMKEYQSNFFYALNFPSAFRAFYSYNNQENKELTDSFDLIYNGMELSSGSQRINKADEYIEKMTAKGMNPENFQFYIDTFKHGISKHGGFAIGLERFTALLLNITNVKECSMFPRDINRIAP